MTKARTVQTPGEAPKPKETPPADAFQATGTDTGAPDGELSNDELRAMVMAQTARLAAQSAQIESLAAAVQNVSRAQQPARAAAEELPDIDSLDKDTITSPVLTKQGWYVPEKFGSHPNAPKL
jgi:hypothetical protein